MRIFLAEKGLRVPTELLAIHEENRTPEFRAKNPFSTLPVLELDDGTCIAESVAICRYFEALHPEPPLFGTTALEQAEVEMWTRRVELNLYLAIEFGNPEVFQEETAAVFRRGAQRAARVLDRSLGEREFLAGARYSMADAFALSAIDFGVRYAGFELDPELAHLARWHRAVSARPSAKA